MKKESKSEEELLGQIKSLQKRVKELEKTEKSIGQLKEKMSDKYVLFRTLLDTITDVIYFKDLKSKFIIINKELANRFGIENPDYAAGKTDFDFFTEEHAKQAYTDEQQIIETGKPKINFIEKETWENGHVTWASTTKMPLKDNKGKIIGTFGISRDISTLTNMQTELKERAEELARSNAELEQFAFIASHDLQEPLRMISCYAQLLEKKYNEKLDEDAREFIWFIVDGAHRMQQLINELLVYSRVNKNVKPFTLVEGQKILSDTLKNLEFKIKDTHAKITYDPMPKIVADASQLTQLFQNLINNAIKFTKNVPEINISVSDNTDEWIFSVTDNGIGIQNDCLETIFEIFRRLHTREEYCGSGIGLSICKKIIERHKGRIWVESEIDKGSKFIFTISKYLSEE